MRKVIVQSRCIHDVTAAVATCTRPAQDQARQNPSLVGEGLIRSQFYLRSYRQLRVFIACCDAPQSRIQVLEAQDQLE